MKDLTSHYSGIKLATVSQRIQINWVRNVLSRTDVIRTEISTPPSLTSFKCDTQFFAMKDIVYLQLLRERPT
ncbi:hypothetical protein KIN20_019754 [Parelaphostrongylus tenuis]|uniref:Uncharacterized protein n=1 Tax=Parelaphostrongylus tenuis TaxID=148309 RepID=A0AAD5N3F7_PARTN|nr:hypothetical protein KIN20_019754 [Parelaphostrongylus tenuis]